MAARRTGPRPGSAAHRAICRLVELGGRTKLCRLLDVIPVEYHTVHMLERYVLIPLAEYAFLIEEGEFVRATPKGKEYAGQHLVTHLPVAQEYVGQIVPGRVQVNRPLNLAKHRAVAPFRPGSDDYKKIPSLFTAEVVETAEVNEHGAIIETVKVGRVVRKLPNGEVVSADV
ncbi:MAG: hypothetical protein WA071_13860 [Undibacterium umbellatum]|uniref:hypothetical protein n=1 Tax=Undibacterium umbellatum TaxID=2762300 RepID=UPI003BB7D95C